MRRWRRRTGRSGSASTSSFSPDCWSPSSGATSGHPTDKQRCESLHSRFARRFSRLVGRPSFGETLLNISLEIDKDVNEKGETRHRTRERQQERKNRLIGQFLGDLGENATAGDIFEVLGSLAVVTKEVGSFDFGGDHDNDRAVLQEIAAISAERHNESVFGVVPMILEEDLVLEGDAEDGVLGVGGESDGRAASNSEDINRGINDGMDDNEEADELQATTAAERDDGEQEHEDGSRKRMASELDRSSTEGPRTWTN